MGDSSYSVSKSRLEGEGIESRIFTDKKDGDKSRVEVGDIYA